jgi:hypothetical protein
MTKKKIDLEKKVEQILDKLLDDAINKDLKFEEASIMKEIIKSSIDFIKIRKEEKEGEFFKLFDGGMNEQKDE